MSVPSAREGEHPEEQAPPTPNPRGGGTAQHTTAASRSLAGRPEPLKREEMWNWLPKKFVVSMWTESSSIELL